MGFHGRLPPDAANGATLSSGLHISGDCSLVRRCCSPKVRKSEIKGSSCGRFVSPKVLKSDNDIDNFLF